MAAWSLDRSLRYRSTSGGAFAELAKAFIAEGGFVAGAVIEGIRVKHIVIDSVADLPRLQGSKYLQSDTRGVYAKVKDLLASAKPVLFSGTPCQVAALRQFLHSSKNLDKLLVIEIVCHGVPSATLMKKYLETQKPVTAIVRFRDKRHGWKDSFGIVLSDQSTDVYIALNENYFTRIFLADNALRRSCYACFFAAEASRADITLSDFWGLKRWNEEHEAGVSGVIVRSAAGDRFLAACTGLHKEKVDWAEIATANPRICSGRHLWLMRWHPLRLLLARNLHHMPARQFLYLYSCTAKLSLLTFGIRFTNRLYSIFLNWHRKTLLSRFLVKHRAQGMD